MGIRGGAPPYSVRLIKRRLPPGLELAPGGMVTGVPMRASAALFSILVSDSKGNSVSTSVRMVVRKAPKPRKVKTKKAPRHKRNVKKLKAKRLQSTQLRAAH